MKEVVRQISDAEWQVMRVVWTQKQTTSKEVGEILNDQMSWKPATTKTLIGRLVKKGLLKTQAEGNHYLYSATVSEEASIQEAMTNVLDQICSTKNGEAIAQMIEKATLSQKDIKKLIKMLHEKEETAPEQVKCNCLPGQCQCSAVREGRNAE
ncbi:CopY/TcrY family copper transport repressor [Lacticigenium naphthae]|uniref:CopY/TcrY family copper transport repressor n=1 Tax=Lacticigenium naphthae TaxID=515351 RepID=UPI0004126120|nr:CopY/TcrY family copper transport repressor [Lacticigenium naphthae]